jgi:ATP-dependent Zn protease
MLTEIEKFVDSLLKNNREELEKLATKLLETEVLNKQDAISLVTKEKINSVKVDELIELLDMK